MTKHVLSALLIISLSLNAYFYFRSAKWEEAWLQQFVTTSEVEDLLKGASPNLSYDDVAALLKGASPVEAAGPLPAGIEKKALKYGGTTFYFKDGIYAGSKADLPGH